MFHQQKREADNTYQPLHYSDLYSYQSFGLPMIFLLFKLLTTHDHITV
ncbi:hypothetical protein THF5H11_150023 [Vibrio jasicida]|nr:hypothetical protein THF5H11_150023 [Vibrio jasicida]CAH1606161.1 hypothetical protein THF5G08_210041 [Vibrio jasicida]